MYITHWSTLEGYAATVSVQPDLLIDYSNNWSGKVFSNVLSISWAKASINAKVSISAKLLVTVASHRQKKGPFVSKTKRGKGTKLIAVADACGLPVAAHMENAPPYEVKLVEATIETRFVFHTPE